MREHARLGNMSVASVLADHERLFREYDVDVAYLFGSYATGTHHEESDVDIGLLCTDDDPAHHRIGALERGLSDRLELPVDCRLLNDADPRFVYNVLRTGRPVFVADDGRRRDFEHRIMRTYLDMKPFYEEYDRYVRERVTS